MNIPARSTGRGVHAEWTKLRTVPSTGWLLLATVAATVLLGAAAAASVSRSRCPPDGACLVDTTQVSLTGVWLGQAVVAVLAVLAVTNEHATRLVQTTLAANPRRVRILLARATVVTAAVLAAGAAAVAGSLLAGRALLPGGSGFPEVSLADGPTLRAATGTVLYLGLVALLSLGVLAGYAVAALLLGATRFTRSDA